MPPSARDLDLRQHHGVETPEHVDVQFELAGVGSRVAAGLLDLMLLLLGFFALLVGGNALVAGLFSPLGMAQSWLAAVVFLLPFCFLWGFFTLLGALNGGRTPGKQAPGIRVVMAPGRRGPVSPASVRH